MIAKSFKPLTIHERLGGRENASCEGDRETRRLDAVGQQLE